MTDKTYLAAQLRRLNRCKDHYTYQIRSDDGSHTNWMNLSQAEFDKVSKLLLDPPANGLQVEEHPDTRAMKAIAKVLSGEEWDSDTVDEVARIIRNHGYEILDSEEEDGHAA